MYFINVSGPLEEIDNFVINNIAPFEIQLVKAFSILDSVKGLIPFDTNNKYDLLMKKVTQLCEDLSIDTSDIQEEDIKNFDIEKIEEELDGYLSIINNFINRKKELDEELRHKEDVIDQIIPLNKLNFEIEKLFDLEYFKYRYGRMPKDSFEKIQKYNESLDIIVYEVFRKEDYVYLMYFMPNTVWGEIDSLFASLYFTRLRIYDDIKGYPKESYERIKDELNNLSEELADINSKIEIFIEEHSERISTIFKTISKLHHIYSVRNYALHSKETFYLTGWLPHSQMDAFLNQMKKADTFSFIIKEDETVKRLKPPTKLKNNGFFKPFESLVSMYGIPSYDEVDPTVFVGITYLIMFGIMFGDLGQGLVIALLGYLLYKKTKSSLGHIAVYLGITSAIAGIFYGSLFGNEEILRKYFDFIPMFNPMEHKTTILIVGIGFGAILIVIAMLLNIINALKSKKMGRLFFDKNGIVGLVIYFSILFVVLSKVMALDMTLIPAIVLIVLSLIIILMSHPLQEFIEGKKEFLPEDKKGFFIESFFELIETVLAILSNTISFMRVGAFALNHVGLVIAFNMLSDMVGKSSGKTGSLIVMIFGNILIIALEGLIVAIQGLRLEYYELFSRFFDGNGSEYKPFYKVYKQN